MAEGEPKVTAVDVLDGNGHLAELKRGVYAPQPASSRFTSSIPLEGPCTAARVSTLQCWKHWLPNPLCAFPEGNLPSENLNKITLYRMQSQLWEAAQVSSNVPSSLLRFYL